MSKIYPTTPDYYLGFERNLEKLPIPKSIIVGLGRGKLLQLIKSLTKIGVIDAYDAAIISKIKPEATEKSLKPVVISGSELELRSEKDFTGIAKLAKLKGLSLCPNEMVLRFWINQQIPFPRVANFELLFASNPISDDKGNEYIMIARYLNGRASLVSSQVHKSKRWRKDCYWIFV